MSTSRRVLLVALATVWGKTASAALIQIDYTGTVSATEGTGLGHSVGDIFSGQMMVDASRVAAMQYCGSTTEAASCEYVSTPDVPDDTSHREPDPEFVTGGVEGFPHTKPAEGARIVDGVYVNDLFTPYVVGGDGQAHDDFIAYNGFINFGADQYYQESNWIRVFDSMVDFISGNDLFQTFELDRDQLGYYGNMYGFASRETWIPNGATIYAESIRYNLTSIRVAPVSVPEPATLTLLSLGLIGMGALRSRRTFDRTNAA